MHSPRSEARPEWAYPFHFAPTEDFEEFRRDGQGVPMVFYPHLQHWVYNPITVAQFGLAQFSRFAEGHGEQPAALACTMANWLAENLQEWKNGIGAWVYHFDLPFYGPAAPWISAMAQGQGISLLLRVHRSAPRRSYEEACHRAVRAFYYPLTAGGAAREFPDGSLAFEEYTTPEPSLVLNGMLFALLGLHDYAEFFDEARSRACFNTALAGVKANLWRYDTGYWNRYDLHRSRRLTSPDYIRIHVQLLRIFAELTRDDSFSTVAQKWQGYLHDYVCRARYLAVKSVEKFRLRFEDYRPYAA